MTHNVGKDYDKIWDEFWNSDAGKNIFTFDEITFTEKYID